MSWKKTGHMWRAWWLSGVGDMRSCSAELGDMSRWCFSRHVVIGDACLLTTGVSSMTTSLVELVCNGFDQVVPTSPRSKNISPTMVRELRVRQFKSGYEQLKTKMCYEVEGKKKKQKFNFDKQMLVLFLHIHSPLLKLKYFLWYPLQKLLFPFFTKLTVVVHIHM